MSTRSSIAHRVWQGYSRRLDQFPLFTKTTTGAVIFFVSDSATQFISKTATTASEWNAARAISGAGFGIVATTWLHVWWGCLELMVASRIPIAKHRLANTLVKVAIDQAFAAPLYIYSYFVVTNMGQKIVQRSDRASDLSLLWKETNDKAAAMLMPTMMEHWTVWPIVHSFNFYFMPLHHRVLVQNTVLVGWSGYLSHLNHQPATLMTPTEEARVAVQRQETKRRTKEEQVLQARRKLSDTR
ncbi:hypothetical protein MPSEU_000501600 [Mayamaea pseudoterrestris]|nr:hypothetical protein MPSEU_000501600 [Mayamaea pseudoterrestris]